MIWHSPWAFLLFVPLLIAVFLNFRKKLKKQKVLANHLKQASKGGQSFRVYAYYFSKILFVSSLIFLILSIARPQSQTAKSNKTLDGIDIVIALDISDSMLIEDMQPENRLEASKKIIQEFISKRQSDRIGLVVFSGESYTKVPLTLDYAVLQDRLKRTTTSQNLKVGTAIGVALANAVARLRYSEAQSKIVIFLTDGESNSGVIPPEDAIDIAKQTDVKIYSIGMGKDGPTKLPTFMYMGGQKIKRYRPFYSRVNEELLNKMAQETGGLYYRASTSDALKSVFESIDRLETSKIKKDIEFDYKELYVYFLIFSLVLLLLSFLLNPILVTRWP